eukprot:Lithocolla_globosa_v1_NODE_7134_length_988_cov_6.876742.p2 type:complete len:120 gc:universal NODE_7134_length_988_cov_6.876742:157-516(+)
MFLLVLVIVSIFVCHVCGCRLLHFSHEYVFPISLTHNECKTFERNTQKNVLHSKGATVTPLRAASGLLLEVIHIDSCYWPSKNLHTSQGSNITTSIVFDEECQIFHTLKFDIFKLGWVR